MLIGDFVLPMLSRLGMTELMIEARSTTENNRDTASIRSWYREQPGYRQPSLSFAGKQTPSTWLADAVSGMWADAVRARPAYMEELAFAGKLRQATWIS